MDTEQTTAGHAMDTTHGQPMDTQVTHPHGHGQVGLYTHRPPVWPSNRLARWLRRRTEHDRTTIAFDIYQVLADIEAEDARETPAEREARLDREQLW